MSRIWNLNPLVNAVVEACAPEEEEAAEQDAFAEDQIISKAFFGLPFLVKGIPPPPTIGNSFSFGFTQNNWKIHHAIYYYDVLCVVDQTYIRDSVGFRYQQYNLTC
jgi:hypothetical protein